MRLRQWFHMFLVVSILFPLWHRWNCIAEVAETDIKALEGQESIHKAEWGGRQHVYDQTPKVNRSDVIIRTSVWKNAIVIEEFKLIFFPIPKVASSHWKMLFRKMMGCEGK